MSGRAGELLRIGKRWLEGAERALLSVRDRGHEKQVIADARPRCPGLRELAQPLGARPEQARSIGQPQPRNRLFGESLNLSRCEDARHE
jgi:hypothetical protein